MDSLNLSDEVSRKNSFSPLDSSVAEKKEILTSLKVFLHSKIFQVVSDIRRGELTEVEVFQGKKVKTDIAINEKFTTDLGYRVLIAGPKLGLDDAAVLDVLISLYLQKNGINGILECKYKEIAILLGYKVNKNGSIGGSAKSTVERSLLRLRKSNIEIRDKSGFLLWCDTILTGLKPTGRGKGFKLILQLNSSFIPHYKDKKIYWLNLETLNSLNRESEKAIYRMICSESRSELRVPLSHFYNMFYEDSGKLKNSEKLYSIKQELKGAIKSLVTKGILDADSEIDDNYNLILLVSRCLPTNSPQLASPVSH